MQDDYEQTLKNYKLELERLEREKIMEAIDKKYAKKPKRFLGLF
jgi:hypothetical protein